MRVKFTTGLWFLTRTSTGHVSHSTACSTFTKEEDFSMAHELPALPYGLQRA